MVTTFYLDLSITLITVTLIVVIGLLWGLFEHLKSQERIIQAQVRSREVLEIATQRNQEIIELSKQETARWELLAKAMAAKHEASGAELDALLDVYADSCTDTRPAIHS
ncbi:MAG: hypothetical protein HQM04_06710 [Magnetococcales bacterium]|nr:hypothetical protein [Magnetococcales bacterium]MBF0114718.1 hypothetical protein [Magnetococcales bacterium]